MKAIVLFSLFFSFFFVAAYAQDNYSVKGIIIDSVDRVKLSNTSVLILNAKDSTLVTYSRAAGDGSFAIYGLHQGKFIILLTYPDYADFVDHFKIDSSSKSYNFNSINMQLRTRLLQEVIVKGTRAAIKIKGDTTEYNAAAYILQPNAKVEDLLKQLPGIQVDRSGVITAQGQVVSKVLVDGEEFFGDDPTLVTKNIRGDMVDKVQLFDKKSDQAAFTGVDDGQKTKTINIKLKEDKKNGYFGKEDVGYGTDGYYQAQLLFNKFSAKQKLSAYATISNDGKTGVGFQDNQKLGTSNNGSDDGGLNISGKSADDLDQWNGNYSGNGIPIAINSGLHFDSKYNNDKTSVNGNYKIGTLTVDGFDNALSQNNLPSGGIINTTSNQTYHNYIFRNKLDLTYQLKLDTTSDLKIRFDGTTKHSQTKSDYLASSSLNDTLQTNSDRSIINKVDARIFNASAFYTKKLKKEGRTFSWYLGEAYNESQAKGYLKSTIDFYNKLGSQDSTQIVDQYKTNHLVSYQLNSNMTYSEPLSKTVSILFNYRFVIDNSTTDRNSFNKSQDGSYTLLDSTLSNNYKLKQVINQGGAILNYKKGKTTINFGTKVSDVDFQQINEYSSNVINRHFIDWFPQANVIHRFSQQSALVLNYSGSTTQPTIDQIQPILINTDPLNEFIGNPGLRPSFTNSLNLFYNSYKVLNQQNLFISGSYALTSNPIVNSTVTDSAGKSATQYINLNKVPYNYTFNMATGRNLSATGIYLGFNLGAIGSKSYNLSNNETNGITLNTYTGSLTVQKYVEKKYDFNFSFGPSLTYGGSSLQRNLNNNGHGWNGSGGFEVYLPYNFLIATDLSYLYNSKTEIFDQDYHKFLLTAWIVKSFTKEQNLKITLICNDVFNQNSGFSRSSSGNLITQDSYTTIKRFFMLTLLYDFDKMAGANTKK